MKKYFVIFLLLICFPLAAQSQKNFQLYSWNEPKDKILSDLIANGWTVEYDEVANTVTAKHKKNYYFFNNIEVKSLILFFSPFDDTNNLIGQTITFADKNDFDSLSDFLKIATAYKVTFTTSNVQTSNMRNITYTGSGNKCIVQFTAFDYYNETTGKTQLSHSVYFRKLF